ncbi:MULTISPECIES: ABC transporter substrate-binding protein [unclassified Mesorhizobium]|uniref:ABC transporter substrate-binding protein n=2 Tax=Mesorhizobium TaxID=68287 RepID=UPI000FC9C1E7|nr:MULTISPECIES: ABC transporter substrate-binding protein [unclassified Mesorhizobium]RVD30885.1 ABC transporter substrate-binding protein [Mesorhizobium sp. M4B.F.Ca.ET.017.02.2.1]RWA66310.1 MAG: ABC transporter substrate-binding protein [Mesorhizobium sp.]RWB85515.1 MAG: ABC transporter substrate-binding protein [Mesorhizobium sp.]RWC97681.1 MAG: ABC transporter substrate-binding protein [Mesorhizobium sp.]TGQ09138.1 ABC transporter substrate-binding protein [Mesorhizobium sp. M4B.F.Ca.ET.2
MVSINRRRFIHGASAIAAGAMSYQPRRAAAQSAGEVIAMLNGGDYAKACMEAYVRPFEAETGIKVTPITDEFSMAKFELEVSNNNVSVDVVPIGPGLTLQASRKGYLEEIDYSIYKRDELDAMLDFAKSPHSVGSIVYALCMVYNIEKFPANKPRPATWAEFWDVVKYPGVRTLPTGEYGEYGPWEEALLADGLPADALYPLDIDRAFASLDKIKPHIRKWFATGSEIQQMLHDKVVDLAESYDGRAVALIDQGAQVEINRNQQKMTWESWAIPKDSPNPENAQRFIEFITRADRQAAFVQLMPYGPTNRNAFKLLPEAVARKFASHPDYSASTITMDSKWYSEVGSDGKTNNDKIIQRWNEWILQ